MRRKKMSKSKAGQVVEVMRAQRAPDTSALMESAEEYSDMAQAMTYGAMATKGLKFSGQRKNAKKLCLTRAQLADMLDDAFRDGQIDKTRWTDGMLRDLREKLEAVKIKELEACSNLRRLQKLCDLMLEKYAGVS